MTGTTFQLIVAATVFVGLHFLLSHPPVRARLTARVGAGPYRGLFALVALAALVWMCFAYARAPDVRLWESGSILIFVAAIAGPIALFLIVGSLGVPSATAGQAATIEGDFPVSGVTRITRNPQLWAIGLWAITHLIATGTLAGTILFGAIGFLAIAGSYHLDVRVAGAEGGRWARFAEHTSNTPFVAILTGRGRLIRGEFKASSILVAVIVSAVFLVAHPLLFTGSAALIGVSGSP